MSDTTGLILAESGYKQAARAASASLARLLEASGPWLKLATVSAAASDLVHSYRTVLDNVVSSGGASIFRESYEHVRGEIAKLVKSSAIESDLRQAIELELRRADVLLAEASQFAARTTTVPAMLPPGLTKESAGVLSAFSQRMAAINVSDAVRGAYAKFAARVKAADPGWATIADLALDRARRVKARFPSINRSNYASDPGARKLVDEAYTKHGKGEMFEHLGRNSDEVKDAMNGELRAAGHRAAQRGADWKPVASASELRLGTETAGGEIGNWKKFADGGVLITLDRADPATVASASAAVGGTKIDGLAQATALFEFKAEKGLSRIPDQQQRALPRMVARWARNEPVYVALNVTDDAGKVSTKVYLLQPPDSKAGLSYYGVGTSNAFIEQRDILARQGASVQNMNVDVSNDEMRDLWNELFWSAFESL